MAVLRLDVKDSPKLALLVEMLKNLDFVNSIVKEEEDETIYLSKDTVLMERIKNHKAETTSNDLVFKNIPSRNDFLAQVKSK